MKIPFVNLHIFTQKRMDKFLDEIAQRIERDNKMINGLLKENALLKSGQLRYKKRRGTIHKFY